MTNTIAIEGKRLRPNGDVITQSELAAAREADLLMQRIGANIARRLELGATVEPGALVIDDYVEPELSKIGSPVPLRLELRSSNTLTGTVEISPRRGSHGYLSLFGLDRKKRPSLLTRQ